MSCNENKNLLGKHSRAVLVKSCVDVWSVAEQLKPNAGLLNCAADVVPHVDNPLPVRYGE